MTVLYYEQEVAGRAWRNVREIADAQDPMVEKSFRALVRSAPAMIQKNGLGQFLAFLASRGFQAGQAFPVDGQAANRDEANRYTFGRLYQWLGSWMLHAIGYSDPDPDEVAPGDDPNHDPLRFLVGVSNVEQLIWSTLKVQEYLQWARRFAESQLAEPEEEA